ncbi:unnamed protein product [Acanthoscelides obtectus]|uniref:H15 domain-containing protein n=1 Tax=Acanthoscelides obtectus TaxID=200917 RepID=A0A9P0LGW8_ACAOB|nr:unnamed protein product [Acanthoscelides obtectus]CAK1635498.1 hypothetical protein AOBTE_LOCUS9310 [Acanthoscelides obtectus]
MNIHERAPRFLPGVMQAIADLKDSRGSTQNKIIDYIQTAVTMTNLSPKPRNIAIQVKKALQHGVSRGLINQRSGKYRLALDQKDFTIYKSLKKTGSLPLRRAPKSAKLRKVKSAMPRPTVCRRRSGRRSKNKKRRRRSGRRRRRQSLGDGDERDIQPTTKSEHSVQKHSSEVELQSADSKQSVVEQKSLDTLSGSYII